MSGRVERKNMAAEIVPVEVLDADEKTTWWAVYPVCLSIDIWYLHYQVKREDDTWQYYKHGT